MIDFTKIAEEFAAAGLDPEIAKSKEVLVLAVLMQRMVDAAPAYKAPEDARRLISEVMELRRQILQTVNDWKPKKPMWKRFFGMSAD